MTAMPRHFGLSRAYLIAVVAIGGFILLLDTAFVILGYLQALDYLKSHWEPAFYFATSGKVHFALPVVGLTMLGYAIGKLIQTSRPSTTDSSQQSKAAAASVTISQVIFPVFNNSSNVSPVISHETKNPAAHQETSTPKANVTAEIAYSLKPLYRSILDVWSDIEPNVSSQVDGPCTGVIALIANDAGPDGKHVPTAQSIAIALKFYDEQNRLIGQISRAHWLRHSANVLNLESAESQGALVAIWQDQNLLIYNNGRRNPIVVPRRAGQLSHWTPPRPDFSVLPITQFIDVELTAISTETGETLARKKARIAKQGNGFRIDSVQPTPNKDSDAQARRMNELEAYFALPGLQGVLKLGMSGTACCNIRTALSALGYQREWRNADDYDDELQSAVLRFQAENAHPNKDGYVGPGTRRLLVKKLLAVDFDFGQLLEVFEYDVALSFASEDRQHVDALAKMLKERKIRYFYDFDEQANIWGKHLLEHLQDIYSRQARFCVMFASKAYADKRWPTHERRAAQERAFQNMDDQYILPVRVDDTKIPGLSPTVGYIDIREGITHIGELLVQKIRAERSKIVTLWSQAHSETFG